MAIYYAILKNSEPIRVNDCMKCCLMEQITCPEILERIMKFCRMHPNKLDHCLSKDQAHDDSDPELSAFFEDLKRYMTIDEYREMLSFQCLKSIKYKICEFSKLISYIDYYVDKFRFHDAQQELSIAEILLDEHLEDAHDDLYHITSMLWYTSEVRIRKFDLSFIQDLMQRGLVIDCPQDANQILKGSPSEVIMRTAYYIGATDVVDYLMNNLGFCIDARFIDRIIRGIYRYFHYDYSIKFFEDMASVNISVALHVFNQYPNGQRLHHIISECIYTNDFDLIRELIKKYDFMIIPEKYQCNHLACIIELEQFDLADALIEIGFDLHGIRWGENQSRYASAEDDTLIAKHNGNHNIRSIEAVNFLIRHDVDLLQIAAAVKNQACIIGGEMLQFVESTGYFLEYPDVIANCLFMATNYNNVDVLEYLLNKQIDNVVHAEQIAYAINCVRTDHLKYFEMFAAFGIDFNREVFWQGILDSLLVYIMSDDLDRNAWMKAFEYLTSYKPYIESKEMRAKCFFRITLSALWALELILERDPDLNVDLYMLNKDIETYSFRRSIISDDENYAVSLIEVLIFYTSEKDINHVLDLMFQHEAQISDEKLLGIFRKRFQELGNTLNYKLKSRLEYFEKRGLDLGSMQI